MQLKMCPIMFCEMVNFLHVKCETVGFLQQFRKFSMGNFIDKFYCLLIFSFPNPVRLCI